MCCILTCLGWTIDIAQRIWVFFMSCCIASAVVCTLITASMSGVAMGYNYSLAEYIELKETNVSVYLKRGVFDDDVVDEMDWRRGGGGPVGAKRSNDENAQYNPPTDFPFDGRRANDEGIFETTQLNKPNDLYGRDEDHHRFEGSLMKLTAKPVHGGNRRMEEPKMEQMMAAYPKDSMENMKAMQALLNRRKMMDESDVNSNVLSSSLPMLVTSADSANLPLDTYSKPPAGLSEELQLIQKLLNDKKMAAKRFERLKVTRTPEPTKPFPPGMIPQIFPDIGSMGGRRMMDIPTGPATGPDANPDLRNMIQSTLSDILVNPGKWYYQRQPTTETNPFSRPTEPRGPVTLSHSSHSSTHRQIKIGDPMAPLTQDVFRKSMEDAYNRKIKNDKEIVAQNIIDEPQKDYNEEDIRGVPIRRRRFKRKKRGILIPPNEHISTNNDAQSYLGTGFFRKFITSLLKLKIIPVPAKTKPIDSLDQSGQASSKDLNDGLNTKAISSLHDVARSPFIQKIRKR